MIVYHTQSYPSRESGNVNLRWCRVCRWEPLYDYYVGCSLKSSDMPVILQATVLFMCYTTKTWYV